MIDGDGLFSVAALADDLDVGLVRQQARQALARERFVVHDKGPDFFHVVVPTVGRHAGRRVQARAPVAPIAPMASGRAPIDGGARRAFVLGDGAVVSVRQGRATDDRDAFLEPMEFEPVVRAELVLQPRARRRDADALLQRRPAPFPTARARRRAPRSRACRDRGRARMSMWPGPAFFETPCLMAFSTSGCSSSVGTQRVERLRLDVEPDDEPVGKAGLLDLEVLGEEVELGVQRDLLLADVLERHPQQIAELHQRAVGRFDVAVHQRRDRVQRVEQEVRLELLPERRHLRFDQPGFELRGAERAVARLAVVEDRVAEPGDRPVRHHFPVEVLERRCA